MSAGMLILPTPREILVLVIVAMALENVLFPMLEQLDRAERMHVRKRGCKPQLISCFQNTIP